ncbi:MAG TPA: AIR synthase, partial [Clostridiales bacterium]|nr:AIR synthase [Clostridiales bacterium]
MKVGKLDSGLLREIVFKNITYRRDEVLIRPEIGEDCAVVDFGEYACVLSTDPITGAVNEVGRLAVNIACNDIASSGVEPLGLMFTVLAPEGTTEEDIHEIMRQAGEAAAALHVEIIGGHTEITNAVNKIVISTTAIGRKQKNGIISSSGAAVGDSVVLTKTAGLEGTAILAHDWEDRLKKHLGSEVVENAKRMMAQISVVPEGIIAGEIGATSMHDVTEGGLLGAVWEICEASGVGVRIESEKIKIAPETRQICAFFNIDPLKLISSGCMLMTIPKEKEQALLDRMKKEGIEAGVIGEIVDKQ